MEDAEEGKSWRERRRMKMERHERRICSKVNNQTSEPREERTGAGDEGRGRKIKPQTARQTGEGNRWTR